MVKFLLDDEVSKLMRKTIYVLGPDETAEKAAKVMRDHNVGSVLVGNPGKPIGIITERDMLNRVLAQGADPKDVKLKTIMSSPLVTIDAKAKVREALELMELHNFRRLVVTEDGNVVGILAQRFTLEEEVEELLGKADFPSKEALRLHPYYRGKIEVIPKVPINSYSDFAIWYTPGVAASSKAIKEKPELVYEHTNKWNSVAIVTDGTRVLGLGDVGPEPALTVMEGKALLYKYLGGVDAFPICISSVNKEEIVETVKRIHPSFGAVNLEDISQPKCFWILDKLRKELPIPVWHDDQQGTATVTLAGLTNALYLVGKDMRSCRIALVGAGAANIRFAHIAIKAGAKPENMVLVDSKGIIPSDRRNLKQDFPEKYELAKLTNKDNRKGGIPEALDGTDVLIAASTPGPDIVKADWLKKMNKEAIVFALANPIPEIWPWDAKKAGARIVATGRSDFANQVNNSLGFPGILRGTLDVQASAVTDEMCVAAAGELASVAQDQGINEDYILPTMESIEVFAREAAAVGEEAQKQGLAKVNLTRKQIYHQAVETIERARKIVAELQDTELVKLPPTHESLHFSS